MQSTCHSTAVDLPPRLASQPILLLACFVVILFPTAARRVHAELSSASADGFQLKIDGTTQVDPQAAYEAFLEIRKWWDPSHSYSLDANNLSIDLEQHALLEQLPDGGFVRHLELVYHAPGKMIRFTGGLGPLQEMGVQGALTVKFTAVDEGTQVQWLYNAHGYAPPGLDALAEIVDRVQTEQFERLIAYCDKQAN